METNENHTPLPPEPSHSSAASVKAGSNQLTTALIVIIVVLLFVMLMLSMNGKLFQSGGNANADVEAMQSRNTQLRAEANAERQRRGLPPLPEDSSSARMMADRIQRDSTSLAALTGQWQTELETKDTALNDLQSQLNSRDENAKRLYAQIAKLQTQLDQAASASSQLASMRNDLQMANNQIDGYRKQLAELQGRPSNEQMALLRKQLNDAIDSRSKLQIQVDTLLEQAKNKIDRSKYDEVVAEIAKLRPQVNTQRYEIQRLRALLDRTRLFIESEKDLPADAARLFAKLRTLENANEQQLLAAYQNIETTLHAKVIHRQGFATGSAQIAFDRETMIKNAMGKGAAVDSYFLVVGYASKTGDPASNRKLSAARATTAASVVNLLKTEQQDVRAVYLGQTNRFAKDDPLANQICEVWEIKK